MSYDTIDLRELAKELDDLRERRGVDVPADHPVQPLDDDDRPPGRTTCGTCGRSWDDGKSTSITPAPAARCPFEYEHLDADDQARLEALEGIETDLGGSLAAYADDQPQAIAEDDFAHYAEELAEEIGAIDRSASWPLTCINWQEAADELAQDYSSFDFEGRKWLVRSR